MANAEIWRARAEGWKASGKSAVDYSHDHGLDPRQLQNWSSKLGLSGAHKPARLKAAQWLPRLVRVVPRPVGEHVSAVVMHKAPPRSGVSLRLGKIRIDVGVGYDDATLRSVLQLVHGGRR